MQSRVSAALGRIMVFVTALMSPASMHAMDAPDTMTGAFDERVRTLQTHPDGHPFFPPMLTLGGDDCLAFSFDIIGDDRQYLRCRIVHCNADWQPSTLTEAEYVSGFNESAIEDYAFSHGTTVNYVNYKITLPNKDIVPLVSGNYLLQVYDETDPGRIMAQWRFMVSEQRARIGASVTSVTDVDYNKAHQQLAVRVDSEREDVQDPFNDLTVVVAQNRRSDNEAVLCHPLRLSGRTAIYEHQAPLVFEAGNEYRRFETASLDYPGMGVASIEYVHPYYHIALETDTVRASVGYLYDSTQRGRFKIRDFDSDDGDTAADYVVVHFSLNAPESLNGRIFIDGDLTSRRFDETSAMAYNRVTGRYEKALLLKQGAYNYQYVVAPHGGAPAHTSPIEGDKYQTVNEYLIKVYTRRPHDRYDRLIGVTEIVFGQ